MKSFFLSRALREKVLLLAFVALGLLIWAGQLLGRGRQVLNDVRSARSDLVTQKMWLENASAIEAKAVAATKSLVPTKTLNATRLVGELSELAKQAGLNAAIGGQHTDKTSQFSFHTVQLDFRRVDLEPLIAFYKELSKRSPYIAMEQFTLLNNDRANPGKLTVSIRIVSAELEGP